MKRLALAPMATLLAGMTLSCGGEESTGPGEAASVVVTPNSATLVALGETVHLTASAQDGNGNTVSGKTFTWSSSNQGVATVSSTGLVTAVDNGLVTITATTGGVGGTADIAVAPAATVTVTAGTAERAVFVFPLEARSEWRWYLPTTAVNQLEYTWHVTVRNNEQTYGFGFWLFKFAGSSPRSGSIGALLAAGQRSVFEFSDATFTIVGAARVEVTVNDHGLTVTVRDPATLTLLFSGRPNIATFNVEIPGEASESRTLSIVYEG